MKHVNLRRAVERYVGVDEYKHGNSPGYKAEFEGMVISWFTTYYDPDSATCVNVRHVSDKHDFASDYHAGSYYDTIKSAINALTYNFRKKNEQMANDNN